MGDAKNEDEPKRNANRKNTAIGCAVMLCLVAIAVIVTVMVTSGGEKEPAEVRLSAKAATGGANIQIDNADTFAWFDVEMKVNGEYVYWRDTVSAGESITVALREFTDGTGTRFNWQTTKPLELVIIACVRSADGASSRLCGDGLLWGHTRLVWQ